MISTTFLILFFAMNFWFNIENRMYSKSKNSSHNCANENFLIFVSSFSNRRLWKFVHLIVMIIKSIAFLFETIYESTYFRKSNSNIHRFCLFFWIMLTSKSNTITLMLKFFEIETTISRMIQLSINNKSTFLTIYFMTITSLTYLSNILIETRAIELDVIMKSIKKKTNRKRNKETN